MIPMRNSDSFRQDFEPSLAGLNDLLNKLNGGIN